MGVADSNMLNRLVVTDLAVFSSADVSFDRGFNVLTGETGAGKSLLIDALGLLAGERANFSLIRSGASEARVSAEFHTFNDPTRALLQAHDISVAEDGLIVHRSISTDNRSRAWVNGVPVTNGFLRVLANSLIEIHGQHEHLALADSQHQRNLLDAAAGALSQAQTVSLASKALHDLLHQRDKALDTLSDRRRRIETLRFQIAEFEQLKPQDQEYETLQDEFKLLHDRERVELAVKSAINLLDEGDTSGLNTLQRAVQALRSTGSIGCEALALIEQAVALTSDAVNSLHRSADLDFDPAHLDWINTRIAHYQSLARKHGCNPTQLAGRWQECLSEMQELSEGMDQVSELSRLVDEKIQAYQRESQKLTNLRHSAIETIVNQVTNALRKLGMPGAEFQILLEPVPEDTFPGSGKEQVRFLVATNPDLAPGPIAQVASGGELSRIALAVEVLTDARVGAEVMVFDEVDAGVSGRIAEMVGRSLKQVASDRQVLCVTHLPQVAALAEFHFNVRKRVNADGQTSTEVVRLDSERRVEAIASMLGGVKISTSAREHARSLLNRA